MTPQAKTKPPFWISRIVLVISMFALLIVAPLCYCPRYYIALAVASIIPLMCGPRLYRWFGGAYILTALLVAAGEHRAALNQAQEIQRMRTAHAQHP